MHDKVGEVGLCLELSWFGKGTLGVVGGAATKDLKKGEMLLIVAGFYKHPAGDKAHWHASPDSG